MTKATKYVQTEKQLAEACGCDERTIRRMKQVPDFPGKQVGKGWCIQEVNDWIAIYTERVRAKRSGGRPLDQLKADKLTVELEMARLNLQHLQGQLIHTDEFVKFVREMAGFVNDFVSRLVNGLCAKLRSSEALRICQTEERLAREWLAQRAGEKGEGV